MEFPTAMGGCCGAQVDCRRCAVRSIAVCAALEPAQLAQLARIASERRIAAGRSLFDEGEPGSGVFTLTAGMLKLFKTTRDGRRQITGFLSPGDFLGLAFDRSYVYSAEAVVDSTVCRFQRNGFVALLERFPQLEHDLLGRASTEIAAAQEQLLLLGRKSARERIASFLVGQCRRLGLGQGDTVPLPMTRGDIADFIGTRVETVSRSLGSLSRAGVVSMPSAHEVVIANWRRLQQEAGP
jgi:CRP/FNR family transcriptional regulator